MSALRPLPLSKRHPSDYRNDQEHREIARLLSELPDKHPARIAYASGAWEGANTLSLMRLLAKRMDLIDRLLEIYNAHAGATTHRAPQL
jgi:hypothetical protein